MGTRVFVWAFMLLNLATVVSAHAFRLTPIEFAASCAGAEGESHSDAEQHCLQKNKKTWGVIQKFTADLTPSMFKEEVRIRKEYNEDETHTLKSKEEENVFVKVGLHNLIGHTVYPQCESMCKLDCKTGKKLRWKERTVDYESRRSIIGSLVGLVHFGNFEWKDNTQECSSDCIDFIVRTYQTKKLK